MILAVETNIIFTFSLTFWSWFTEVHFMLSLKNSYMCYNL